ncbi:uncharacterized protein THITE_2131731 [Thermothielavioides terrestris NRRL 8126]|uniref:Uncharacterized protein n=1 Tax=Thermothielavioides terrestris (strain ATCC 38088 / NRRL 8126) TaxID=578455 RepID=G2REW6_THETT|nr:uncharacterized protein THITE_2131731 [Thermothielavioides terrestris NRRL 8126]AEO70249.1 hypothetical protein THITE_2131731 [Thermothielavioides terrestris NRRL 8126]
MDGNSQTTQRRASDVRPASEERPDSPSVQAQRLEEEKPDSPPYQAQPLEAVTIGSGASPDQGTESPIQSPTETSPALGGGTQAQALEVVAIRPGATPDQGTESPVQSAFEEKPDSPPFQLEKAILGPGPSPDQGTESPDQSPTEASLAFDSDSEFMDEPLDRRASALAVILSGTPQEVGEDDEHGVWYLDRHGTCLVGARHRHDKDGGVYFASYSDVLEANISTREEALNDAIDDILGLAYDTTYPINARLLAESQVAALTRAPGSLAKRSQPQGEQSRAGLPFSRRPNSSAPSVPPWEALRHPWVRHPGLLRLPTGAGDARGWTHQMATAGDNNARQTKARRKTMGTRALRLEGSAQDACDTQIQPCWESKELLVLARGSSISSSVNCLRDNGNN